MQELGVPVIERDFSSKPLSAEEIREIAGSGSPVDLLNPARDAYRERGFDQRRPSEEEALQAMLEEPNLIFRPITIRGERMVKGLDEGALRELLRD